MHNEKGFVVVSWNPETPKYPLSSSVTTKHKKTSLRDW